jgi:hypothetical protein
VTTTSQRYHAENVKEPNFQFMPKVKLSMLKDEQDNEINVISTVPVKNQALTCLRTGNTHFFFGLIPYFLIIVHVS